MNKSLLFPLTFILLIIGCERENNQLPTVTTMEATGISAHSALSGGIITNNGGARILACGVAWDTVIHPDVKDFLTNDSLVADTFISRITGLLPGITYYVRAYATNSEGTSYGLEVNFTTLTTGNPVVVTTEAISIAYTSAVAGGEIPDSGFQTITAKGICWNTSSNPTVNDFLTNEGRGAGTFSSEMTGLTPGTKYYFRAYITYESSTVYGEEESFTTLSYNTPVVVTAEATKITFFSAYAGGEVTDSSMLEITAKGICWSTSPVPTLNNSLTNEGQGAGKFTSHLQGLTPGLTYYYKAYATNSTGTSYGEEKSFQTPALPVPGVTTDPVTGISALTALFTGNVADTVNDILARGFCYGIQSNPTLKDNSTDEGPGPGLISYQASNLLPGTTYYVRAYASLATGVTYGNEESFVTNDTLPVVTTMSVTSITPFSAAAGGSVTSDGGDQVTGRGFCWSESSGPTLADNTVNTGSGTGCFIGTLTNLDPNSTYYLRSYATNSTGTAFGEELLFSTKDTAEWILVFSDDFESYETGTHPAAWTTMFTGSSAGVSEDVAYDGNKSFMLSSLSSWARVEAIPLDSVASQIRFEGAVYVNQANKGYFIGFGFKESGNTYRYRNGVGFSNENQITFAVNLQAWMPQTWYKVTAECDFSIMKAKVWIDDVLVSTDLDMSAKEEIKDFCIGGLNFSGSASKAYYDNIKVWIRNPEGGNVCY